MVPMDHGITLGPLPGLVDYESTIQKLNDTGVNAIIGHMGLILHRKKPEIWKIPFIFHISASSDLSKYPNHKVIVNPVEEAIRLGADAVSVHINIGGSDDGFMLETLGRIACECRQWGLPLLAMMYARGDNVAPNAECSVENVKKVARIGAELGADIVKTNYTGDIDSFKEVVKGCPVPVVIAGGPVIEPYKILQTAWEAMQSGAKGVSFGRNLFQSSNPHELAKAITRIVHERFSLIESLEQSPWKDHKNEF